MGDQQETENQMVLPASAAKPHLALRAGLVIVLLLAAALAGMTFSSCSKDELGHQTSFDGGYSAYDSTTAIIALQENPTTGYSWVSTADKDILTLTESADYRNQNDVLGTSGVHFFTFTVPDNYTDSAVETLTFAYNRTWEDPTQITLVTAEITIEQGEIALVHVTTSSDSAADDASADDAAQAQTTEGQTSTNDTETSQATDNTSADSSTSAE